MRFPRRQVQGTKQLLSTLAMATQIAEFCPELPYPHFGVKTQALARSLYTKLIGVDEAVVVDCVSELSPSWLAMWVAYFLICATRINPGEPSMELVLWCLKKKLVPRSPEQGAKSLAASSGSLKKDCQELKGDDSSDEPPRKKKKKGNRNRKGETRLHVLSRSKRLQELRQTLEEDASDVNASDNFGWTPLLEAVSSGRKENVLLLLAHGSDPWQRCKAHTSPLLCSCEGNYPDIVRILLEHTEGRLLSEELPDGGRVVDLPHSSSVLEALREGQQFWNVPPCVANLLPVYLMSYQNTYHFWDILHGLCIPGGSNVEWHGQLRLNIDLAHFVKDCLDYKMLLKYLELS